MKKIEKNRINQKKIEKIVYKMWKNNLKNT